MRAHVLALLATALVVAACGRGDDEEESAPPTTATGGGQSESAGCRDVPLPKRRPPATGRAPGALLNAAETYRVRVDTSCGTFTITLDTNASPRAAASFVALIRSGFFDGTVFHRIVPGFVIQGGDPTQRGGGGPGYTTVDTPAAGTTYTEGVVAMAKAATEPRGAAGSQFFVVTAADAGLPPDYAVIGRVTEGLDVVRRIGVLGDPHTELPTQPVAVTRMRVLVT